MTSTLSFGTWALFSPRLGLYSTITSSSAVAADFPLTYMAREQQPTDITRFTDISVPIVFDVDLSVPMTAQGVSAVRGFFLPYNNSGPADTWQVQGAASLAAIGSPTYDSGSMLLWPSTDCRWFRRIHSRLWIPGGRTETYYRFTINSTAPRKASSTSPTGLTLADYWQTKLLIDYGYAAGDGGASGGFRYANGEGLAEESKQVVADGGPIFPRIRPKVGKKNFSLILHGASRVDEYRSLLAKIRRWTGVSRSIFLAQDLTGTDNQMETMTYGLFDSLADVSHDLVTLELALAIKEML